MGSITLKRVVTRQQNQFTGIAGGKFFLGFALAV